tara:strand:+ start:2343 stop:2489 length:147 start_codon:yes stop_codon:yes gene_type:complete
MTRPSTPAQHDALLAARKLVVFDFFGTWRQHCKMMAPAVRRCGRGLAA